MSIISNLNNSRFYNNFPPFIIILENKNIAELQFLNMVATAKNLVQPELIGTFLHHAIFDALMSDFGKNGIAIIKNLKALFKIKEQDILLMTQILAMNDFSNLKLLKPYDTMNENLDFKRGLICSKDSNTVNEQEQELEETKSKHSYFKPSPCYFNESIANGCKEYCQWQAMIYKELTDISAFQR